MCDKIKIEYVPFKLKGMRISFDGMMRQTQKQLKIFEQIKVAKDDGDFDPTDDFHVEVISALDNMTCFYSHTIEELIGHFKKLGEAFYRGDLRTVDNVLQLWCLKPELEDEVENG